MGNTSVEEHFGKIPHLLKAGSFGEQDTIIRINCIYILLFLARTQGNL